MTNDFLSRIMPQRINELLDNFGLRTAHVSGTPETFGCLALFNQSDTDVVVVLNPDETNRLVLLDHQSDLFFLGVGHDVKLTTKGILPAWKTKGSNHIVLNDPLVLIVRSPEVAKSFLNLLKKTGIPPLRRFDNGQSHLEK